MAKVKVTIQYPEDTDGKREIVTLVTDNAHSVAVFIFNALEGWCVDDDLTYNVEEVVDDQ